MTAQVTITGNSVVDAELRFTPQGKAVASFRVAVNERVKNQDGSWGDGDPTFYSVSAWDSLAETTAEQIKKGTRVIVTGKLKAREYESKDGGTRTSIDIRAEELGICVGYRKAQSSQTTQATEADTSDPWNAPF
jgi:single-strand DNA-binding protein